MKVKKHFSTSFFLVTIIDGPYLLNSIFMINYEQKQLIMTIYLYNLRDILPL